MTDSDYLKRLEDKVNMAIDHIEKLTLDNERLKDDKRVLEVSLDECKRKLTDIRLSEHDRSSQVRDKLRSILRKVDALDEIY